MSNLPKRYDRATLVKISDLYYMHGLTQQEISNIAHIHRTEISRILKVARDEGVVSIAINPETTAVSQLIDFFKQKYNLREAVIVPASENGGNELNALSVYASMFLSRIIKSGDVIGLSWGSTLSSVISQFPTDKGLRDIKVVPLVGGPMGRIPSNYHVSYLTHRLANRLNGTAFVLDSPAFVRSKALRKELLANPNTQEILGLWNRVNIAIFGIGSSLITDSPDWQAFYENTNFKSYFSADMVGDILSHPFDKDGKLARDIDSILVAFPFSALRKVPHSVGIAFGEKKVNAILAALRGGLLNTLITTEATAKAIKELS